MPDRSDRYQLPSWPPTNFDRDLWNGVFGDIADRLAAREELEASFEALISQGIQASLDYIQVNVAPQISSLQTSIQLAQQQIDQIIIGGVAPNALKLGGQLPAYYATAQQLAALRINGKALTAETSLTKADIGLGGVDNTPDAEKPISQAQALALSGKQDKISNAALENNTFADADRLVKLGEEGLEIGTVAGFISSIFKTARTIADAVFASATFKLKNAGGYALTFNTSAQTADRVVMLPDADVTLATPAFTKYYESPEQPIVLGGLLTLTHEFGVKPLVQVWAKCVTAESGYAVGDELLLTGVSDHVGAAQGFGLSTRVTNASVLIRIGANGWIGMLINASNGASAPNTPANWRLIVRAWA